MTPPEMNHRSETKYGAMGVTLDRCAEIFCQLAEHCRTKILEYEGLKWTILMEAAWEVASNKSEATILLCYIQDNMNEDGIEDLLNMEMEDVENVKTRLKQPNNGNE